MQFHVTRRAALLGAVATWAAKAAAQEAEHAFEGLAGTTIRFAGVDAGQRILTADDEWMLATSEFQRRAVTGSSAPVSLEAFRRWNGDAVRPWASDQRARWRQALEALAPGWAALRIPLPKEVLLIASNGQESASAPYTRSNAVVLPGVAAMPGYSDTMLMAHELWHVASRHAVALASRLYAEIGFEPMPRLVFPEAWAHLRIANPDAPENGHAMRLAVDGREALFTPVLVAARDTLKPGETFFSVMDVRLLEVRPDADGRSRAVLRDGQPAWLPVRGAHDYLRRLGGNTGYVIHPEETMADNVALLATGRPGRNTELLSRIRAVLLQTR
jgi:hypothetical protein